MQERFEEPMTVLIRFLLIAIGWLALAGTSTWVWLTVTQTTMRPLSTGHERGGMAAGIIAATLLITWFFPLLGAFHNKWEGGWHRQRFNRWACVNAAEVATRITWAVAGILLIAQGLAYVALRAAGTISVPAQTASGQMIGGAIVGAFLIAIVGLLYLISSGFMPLTEND